MEPNDAAAPFLPTLARARAEHLDLPPGPPKEERRLAALVVLAAMMRRESWEEEAQVSRSAAKALQPGEPPAPDAFEPQSHRRLAAELGTSRCTMCAATPGQLRCRICRGAGRVPCTNPLGSPCSCETGFVPCPQCDGAGESARVRIRYLFDRPVALREIYVPAELTCVPELFSFESGFEGILGAAIPPESLRCHDLRPRVGGSAYRGGEREIAPEFRGHGFGDTVDKATAALGAVGAGGKLVRSAVRAYAWPLLWLRYTPFPGAAHEAVVFADPDGALRAIQGRPTEAV